MKVVHFDPEKSAHTRYTLGARQHWSVFLSCAGEPLLCPDFEKAIALSDTFLNKTDVSIVTNGFLLDETKRNILASSKLSRVYISIYTINPDLYARLCSAKEATVSNVKDNIVKLANACRNKDGPKVILISIAMRSTLPLFMELADWAVNAGVSGMRVHWLTLPAKGMDANEKVPPAEALPTLTRMAALFSAKELYFEFPYIKNSHKMWSVLKQLAFIKNK